MELATPGDDAGLRRLLREHPIPGRIALSFEREPRYFAASVLEGGCHQTIVARDAACGEVLGCANRSVRELFVNGVARPVGYLSQMRAHPRLRHGMYLGRCVARAFQLLAVLHRDGRAPFYLMSIVAGNESARRLLASGLPGFPRLRSRARLVTAAIHVGRPGRPLLLPPGLRLGRGSPELLPSILACLERHGRRRQFAPRWTEATLCRPEHTPGLAPHDFHVVLDQGGEVVGCLARWDQRGFKQTVVRGYGGGLAHRGLRQLLDLGARTRLAGWPRLPEPGEQVRSCFASHRALGEERAVLAALLRALYNEAAARGDHFLVIGFDATDPLLAVLRRYRTTRYESELFLAAWEDGEEEVARVDGRMTGVEVAVL